MTSTEGAICGVLRTMTPGPAVTVKAAASEDLLSSGGWGFVWVRDSFLKEEMGELRSERRRVSAFPHQVYGLKKEGKWSEGLRRGLCVELGTQGGRRGAQNTTGPIAPRQGFDVHSKKNEKSLKSYE